MNNTWQDL